MARRVTQDRLDTALGVNRGVPRPVRSSRPAPPDGEEGEGGSLDQIIGLVFGLAGLAFAGFLIFEGLNMAGARQRTAGEMARITAVADPKESPLFRDADPAILSTCFVPDTNGDSAHYTLAVRDRAVGQYAAFLVCAMQMQRDRLCDGRARSQLVDQINRYREVRYELADIYNSHLTAAGVRVAMNSQDLADGVSRAIDGHGTGTTVAQFHRVPGVRNERFDAGVGYQLEALVRAGYLSRGDFTSMFGGVSGEIAPFVEVPPSGQQACG